MTDEKYADEDIGVGGDVPARWRVDFAVTYNYIKVRRTQLQV